MKKTWQFVKFERSEILNIKQLREKQKITQKDVAVKADISESYYSLIENGERTPKPEVIKKIANVLGFEWSAYYE